jgi:hypothetical protein
MMLAVESMKTKELLHTWSVTPEDLSLHRSPCLEFAIVQYPFYRTLLSSAKRINLR